MLRQAALCVGGPLHGQFVSAFSNTMRIVNYPERHIGNHDQVQIERWTEGTYSYGNYEKNREKIPLWLWDGWDS